MIERIGIGLATGLLLAGCTGSGQPQLPPPPSTSPHTRLEIFKVADIITFPPSAKFYEEPNIHNKSAPCGVLAVSREVLVALHIEQGDRQNIVDHIGAIKDSVFPPGSDPAQSCAQDKDGVVWARVMTLQSPLPKRQG